MQARIWIYWNHSPVRITVREGHRVHLYRSEPTDEGYSYEGEDYYFSDDEPGVIVRESHDGGRDCDGPIHRHRVDYWRVGGPVTPMVTWGSSGNCVDLPELRPVWEYSNSWQRDLYAEVMGY